MRHRNCPGGPYAERMLDRARHHQSEGAGHDDGPGCHVLRTPVGTGAVGVAAYVAAPPVCVQYRPVTTCTYQPVTVTRPVVKYVPETVQVQRTRTKFNPVKETIQVCQTKVEKIPIPITQCVTTIEMQPYDLHVTRMVQKPITETFPVTITTMVPESKTEIVPTVKCRPVTETVTRQVAVCVPYQVPVTVMTTQTADRRPPGPSDPECDGTRDARPDSSCRLGPDRALN